MTIESKCKVAFCCFFFNNFSTFVFYIQGDVISTKFEEVKAITLAHDIQVDNPISVLNQDTAKTFHRCDAKKKYELFRQATNLEQTEKNYKEALQNCNKAIAIWNRKNEVNCYFYYFLDTQH